MIEIKEVKYDPREKVTVCAERFKDLLQTEESALQFYKALKQMVIDKYVKNYACFGNGGGFTCEELADLLGFRLPSVEHIGVDEWIKLQKGLEDGKEETGKDI